MPQRREDLRRSGGDSICRAASLAVQRWQSAVMAAAGLLHTCAEGLPGDDDLLTATAAACSLPFLQGVEDGL